MHGKKKKKKRKAENTTFFFICTKKKMYQARLLTKKYVASTHYSQLRFMQQLTSPQLRTKFIKYFENKGHVPVKSASLVPHNDKSLLFTNAGTHNKNEKKRNTF